MIKLKLSTIFKILIYSWLTLLIFPLVAFLGKPLILLSLMLLPTLLLKPTRKLTLASLRTMTIGVKHRIDTISNELDRDFPNFHTAKNQSKETVYIGDIYDENVKKYYKLHLSLDELNTVIIYGNPSNILATILPQISISQNIVIFDSDGSLYSKLREVMPIHYLTPQEFPLDPMKLGAEDAHTIFSLAFYNISHEIQTKLKALIHSYYDQLSRKEHSSLKQFLEDFLEKQKGSAADRIDLANIEKVQDLCCDMLKSHFLNGNTDTPNILTNFLYFDLSNIPNENLRMLYALTAMEVLHLYWGHFFCIIGSDILPLSEHNSREKLRKIEQLLKYNVSLCITTDGCPIDTALLNYAKTLIIGNCMEDYRLSHTLQKMFPHHSPYTLRPVEYLIKNRETQALLVCPPFKTAKNEKKNEKKKEQLTALEADFSEDSEKAYDMLQQLNNAQRMPRPALLAICGYDEDIADRILVKMVKRGYTAYKTEAVKGRFIPVIKLTTTGTEALKEFSMKLQGQKKLEEATE